MRKSVKLYMIQDLSLLLVLGLILEFLSQRFASTILSGTPTIAFALFVVFVAVARWNLWGLLIVPFMGLATWLGGSLGEVKYLADAYDWRVYISETAGLLTVGVNYLFFRGHKTNKVILNIGLVIAIIAIDYLLYNGVQFVVYRLCCTGNPFKMGEIGNYYHYVTGSIVDGENVFEENFGFKNYCSYIEQGFVYNLFGLAVLFVGVFILRSQGVIVNAVDKLIADKKLAEAEEEYLKNLGNDNSDAYSALAKIKESDELEEKSNDSEEI